MREMKLVDFIATDLGRFEARLQLITFGADYRQSYDEVSELEMLYWALALARRPNVILASSECSDTVRKFLAKRLSFRPGPLGRLNVNDPALHAAHLSEIGPAVELVNSINASEREFYDFICRSFRERRGNRSPYGRERRASHLAEPLAGCL